MEAAKHDKRTVFVRGIPFSTGAEDFEAFFSELGPVRTSFLVKDKGQTGHKGFGFVQFALPEDAQRATEQLHNSEFQGRKLKVEPAVKRAPLNDRKKRKLGETDSSVHLEDPATTSTDAGPKAASQATAPASVLPVRFKAQAPAVSVPSKATAGVTKKARKQKLASKVVVVNPKQRLVRTIALGNVDPQNKEEVLALAQAAGKVDSVEDPPSDLDVAHARLKQDGCTGTVIFVVYDSVKTGLAAVAKLHGQPLSSATRSAKRLKSGGEGDGGQHVWARQVSGEGLHLKKWRLIIRNLAFKAKPTEVKAALEMGGSFVWDLSLPRNSEGALKGFGFATFMTRGHAESAIKTTNGQVVAGRQVVVDWAMAKARFTDATAQTADGEGQGKIAQPSETVPVGSDLANTQDAALLSEGEDEGVDAAQVMDSGAEQQMVQNVLDSLLQDDEPDEAQVQLAGKPGKAAGEAKPSGKGDEVEAGSKQVAVPANAAASKVQPERPGKNVDASGEGAGARDSSKTVFVRSLPPDVSQDQLHIAFKKFGKLRACRLVMNKESQQPKGTAFVEYWDKSAAQAAAAACQKAREGGAGGVMVGGRTVEVNLALSQDDARNLASGGRAASGLGKDNRNLYLAKEGTIEEGSAAWESMSVTDRGKRKRAAEEKNTKLRSPNFSVSRTRLSVRNIPFTMQEKELKQLFIAAVKEHASKAQPRVKQIKILRDAERIDPADGLSRSRGLGFVEFTEHEHAICALRQLNNNPAPFSRDKRPVVEFALESAQAVRKMASKQAWQKAQAQGKAQAGQQAQPADPGEQSPAVPVKKTSKERQLAKKRPAQQEPAAQGNNKRSKSSADPAAKPHSQDMSSSLQLQSGTQSGMKPKRQVKQQPNAASKQSVQRKRQADAALDQLAARPAAATSGAKQKTKASKGGQGNSEKGDKLDDMISNYKAKYFGGQAQSAPGPAGLQQPKQASAGISRWFE